MATQREKPFMNANIPILYSSHKSIINCNASAGLKDVQRRNNYNLLYFSYQ